MKLLTYFLCLVISFVGLGNVRAQDKTYQTNPTTSLKYHFINHDSSGKKPAEGDVTKVILLYKTQKDSVLFDSHAGKADSNASITIPIKFPFKGCLEQGIAMMAVGDSASFIISADSLYLKAFKQKALPSYMKHGDILKFNVKLLSFKTAGEMKEQRTKKIESARAELNVRKMNEAMEIKKYLSDNHLKIKPAFTDSIYVVERSGKPGRAVNDGDSVEIRYKAMLTDGTIFDQSDSVHGHASYKFQYSHEAHLIRGWIEILGMMHEGEKVKVLVPSSLAFGSNQAGEAVKPYSPLIYEIEVLKVIPFN